MISYRGARPPSWVIEGVRAGTIPAVCLFAYNFESLSQLREANEALHEAARAGGHPPPLVAIDQEGGQVQAVTGGATELPGNMALGATGSEELARRAGKLLATELLALGCNVNLSPVLDLAGHLHSAVVGNRSFGDDPALVARLGAAMIVGMQEAGVIATAKHFPGHGDTALDSHHALPVVTRSLGQLEEADLIPFRAAITAGVGAVMSAHIRYPSLDEEPATLSRKILTELLRGRMGYRGLAITDAMDMAAVADGPASQRALQALAAGADLVLLGHLPAQAELVAELSSYRDAESRARIDAARARTPRQLPPLEGVGSAEGRALALEIACEAVTLVPGAVLEPLRPAAEDIVRLVTFSAPDLSPADSSSTVASRLADQLRRRHPRLEEIRLPYGAEPAEIGALVESLGNGQAVIVGTTHATGDPVQRMLLAATAARVGRVVHLALRSPADALHTPHGVPTLCTYGVREANTEAAAQVLFGEGAPRGKLPVSLPERSLAPGGGA